LHDFITFEQSYKKFGKFKNSHFDLLLQPNYKSFLRDSCWKMLLMILSSSGKNFVIFLAREDIVSQI